MADYLVYGTRSKDLHALAEAIEAAFGIRLENREGLFQGGEYFLGRLLSGESVGLFHNYNGHDERFREPANKDSPLVFYVYGADPAGAPAYAQVVAKIPGLSVLKKIEREGLVNVIDLEATCWETEPPTGQSSDIIEIGITVIELKKLEALETRSILVNPAQSDIGEFCTRLTTITPAMVHQGGIPLEAAYKKLRSEFESRDRVFASYGDYDRRMFERQCAAYRLAWPLGRRHLNVKSLVALVLGLDEEVGMMEALARLNLAHEGTNHRGGDDSRNVARILARLLGAARSKLAEW